MLFPALPLFAFAIPGRSHLSRFLASNSFSFASLCASIANQRLSDPLHNVSVPSRGKYKQCLSCDNHFLCLLRFPFLFRCSAYVALLFRCSSLIAIPLLISAKPRRSTSDPGSPMPRRLIARLSRCFARLGLLFSASACSRISRQTIQLLGQLLHIFPFPWPCSSILCFCYSCHRGSAPLLISTTFSLALAVIAQIMSITVFQPSIPENIVILRPLSIYEVLIQAVRDDPAFVIRFYN